ncbi:GSCOCG00012312001-RA-CDS [Cotesia congregata]|uniref:Similar to MLH3: DNA mismatch repair protein Mlh3 (Homo sapiens) n=1 Tax=Cotesia congregata TaxID=51543 RepID=A0A8J2H6Z2_COTCN|nr:GSCOCG00012312001-RA-CDS [Cotesia congregata]CAG5079559.1 Similar to MLH3: DNA mismatch repair protein Mlh3 (Homo sapiens) [Cotesia congregata]
MKSTYSQSQYFFKDLVRMSLDGSSTSVAIRIYNDDKKIQIIDNGHGIDFQKLEGIGVNYQKMNDNIFKHIHQLPVVVIMTKPKNSQCSYGKVLQFGHTLNVQKILDRPLHGTTVIVYFNDSTFGDFLNRQNIIEIVEDYALDYPQVSFTIRDDIGQKLNVGIKRKYCNQLQPNSIVKKLKYSPANLFNLELDSINHKNSVNEIMNVLFHKQEKNNKEMSINKNTTPFSRDNQLKIRNNYDNDITCDDISTPMSNISGEWSDWISPLERLNNNTNNDYNYNPKRRKYSFLPEKLNKVLRTAEKRLFPRQSSNQFDKKCFFNFDSGYLENVYDVRICKNKKKLSEITIDKNSLKHIKVLRQVNVEYIAGIVEQNKEKILILIDQHAMDERIRYENLLEDYKYENKFISVTLKRPIKINNVPRSNYDLLLRKREVLKKFGLNIINSSLDDERNSDNSDYFSLIITSVPKCFLFKKIYNETYVIELTAKLLMEVAEKLINKIGINTLPSTIHNVIASEACHGAIKFGDPLNINQCNDLLNYWIQTDLPNRCAHGRPVIIPLLTFNK